MARLYLENYSSSDLLIQARAYSMIGDTYMEQNNFADAAKYYEKAADYKPNKFFTPTYLMKAALAFEKNNEPNKAKEAYAKIINDYWDSAEFQNAKKLKARLDGNA